MQKFIKRVRLTASRNLIMEVDEKIRVAAGWWVLV